ncbi:hypothetical protein M527_28720 [Sphingobium indicum IP26]|uniref:Uncharacterized protein n=1 Tax=Sphingobium indicum F2 TaxID=1450518 RepID=A0A8E0WP69_9SPHN|nr:hypothetical protein M527_28720 [Sphingobium indicum IP26]EQB07558.1 hypothetical protein L286_03495 [Sphingobium sp. HDIP04]KER34859.1 hypothetical protein AL00_19255 [Sphingobium indicum F2]
MFGPPLFALTLDPHDFQPIETSSDTLDHDCAIDMAQDVTVRLKLPFAAAMNREDEPARLPAHDTLHRMKRA